MQVIKSLRTKLYPTATQKAMLYKMFNADRFIYNHLLGLIKDHHFGDYVKDPTRPNIPSKFDLVKEITKIKETKDWLYYTPNDYLQASAANLHTGFAGFYRGGGYPKFKSRKVSKQSINCYAGTHTELLSDKIWIPKQKTYIKFKYLPELPQEYKITGYSISKDKVGEHWLSLTYKYNVQDLEINELKVVGCDLGLKEALITSDGVFYPRLRLTREYEDKLAKAQRQHSKKQKGSKNHEKSRIKVAKIHRKIAAVRKHNNHCISRDLVNQYNFIALESLQVKNMIKNRKLSKAIQDVAWSQLVYMIQYKQAENQGLFHRIDTFYPSSKLCSCCGSKKTDLTLADRTYHCTECGAVIDRDINASLNILRKGLLDSGFTEQEICTLTELPRNNRELYKVKSVESQIRPLAAQDIEAERNSELCSVDMNLYNLV